MITLKTLPQATAQEVFDQVKNHLLTQRRKCEDGSGRCKYRYNGLQCAAGCLISKDEYYSNLEDSSWYILSERGVVPLDHKSLIIDLQKVHDHFTVLDWESELEKTAIKHKLKYE